MRRTYFTALILTTLGTVLMMIPSFAMLSVIFTFGLAVPLLFILPMATLLLWSLLPAALVPHRPLRLGLAVLGPLLVIAATQALPRLADQSLARDLATMGIIAPANLGLPDGIGVEIHRRVEGDADLYVHAGSSGALYGQAPCFDLCERLLTGGQVAWVRIKLTDDAVANDRVPTSALLVAAPAARCQTANPDLPADQTCVLYAPDHGLPADLTLILSDGRTNRPPPRGLYQRIGERTATAHIGSKTGAVAFHLVQIFHERPNGAIMLNAGALGNGNAGGGLMLARTRAASAAIDLVAAMQALGLSLGPARAPLPKAIGTERNIFIAPPPDAQDAAYVASLLQTGPTGMPTFSNAWQQVVNGWHDRLRWKSALTPADRALFCASLADTRLPNLFWDDQVIRKHGITCP